MKTGNQIPGLYRHDDFTFYCIERSHWELHIGTEWLCSFETLKDAKKFLQLNSIWGLEK